MRKKLAGAIPLVLVLLLTNSPEGRAADLNGTAPPAPSTAIAVEPEWEVQTTLYLWATAIEGSLGIGNLPNANVDVSFSDILENLDGALMGDLFVKRGSWMFLGDIVWANLSDKATLKVGNSPTLKYNQQLLILSAIAGYELPLNIDALDVSATAGVRYQNLSSEMTLQSGTYPVSVNRDRTESWIDPVFGLALQYDINDRWTINGVTDIGGFGVGSQLTAQGFLAARYNWTDRISTAFGYRAIYTNYESGSGAGRFDYESTLHGPVLSVGIHF